MISTVQKFPFILDEIGSDHRGRRFAIFIDEAHSSQGGKTSAAVAMALSTAGAEEGDETLEDQINRLMEAKKLLPNASYFAFTATTKNKTLEMFGEPVSQADGTVKHRPFHSCTMKQAIQEGFILDVLEQNTPVESYYRLVKKGEGDPEFDTKRAKKKLRRYVESHDHAIRLKAEIMVDHFHEQVLALNKIGGEARAMVVTTGIERAMHYFNAIRDYLTERKSRYRAVVAFSGEHDYGGAKVTEASLNNFTFKPDRRQDRGGSIPVPDLRGEVPDCLVSPTEEMSAQTMAPVKPNSISRLQPLHAANQIGSGSLHQQMIVISHQHPTVDSPPSALTRLAQILQPC